MQFWDLGRRDDDEMWGERRSRMYQTMDPPNLFGALPRPYRWAFVALWLAAAWLVSIYVGR
jgi:hypothetical protein